MNYSSKVLIPIGLAVFASISVVLIMHNEIHPNEFEYPRPCLSYCDEEPIIMEAVLKAENTNDPEALHEVLRHCKAQAQGLPVEEPGLSFMNSTHHIDNILCEWHTTDHPKHPFYTMNEFEESTHTGGIIGLDKTNYTEPLIGKEAWEKFYEKNFEDDFEINYEDEFN